MVSSEKVSATYLLVVCSVLYASVYEALAGGTSTSYNSYGSYGSTASGLDRYRPRGYGYGDGIGTGRDIYSQRDFRDYPQSRYPFYGSGSYGRLPLPYADDARRFDRDDYNYRYDYITPINYTPRMNYYGDGRNYGTRLRPGYDTFPLDLWKKK